MNFNFEFDKEKFLEDFQYLHANYSINPSEATKFWNKYNELPNELIKIRQYDFVRERMFWLLSTCKKLNESAFNDIPKGHPYYYVAITSYYLHDYETALYFFDAAVTEDLRFVKLLDLNFPVDQETKDKLTPAYLFMLLCGDSKRQAAQEITKNTEELVQQAISHYKDNFHIDPELTMDDLRAKFIYCVLKSNVKGIRTLVTALLTYLLEWNFRKNHMLLGVRQETTEPFFLHLFKGCLLFESLLKTNPKIPFNDQQKKDNLGAILNNEAINLNLNISSIINKRISLDDVFKKLIEINGSKHDLKVQDAIQITYMARNTLGHNLGWETKITLDEYTQLYNLITSACLHVINCLWKQHD